MRGPWSGVGRVLAVLVCLQSATAVRGGWLPSRARSLPPIIGFVLDQPAEIESAAGVRLAEVHVGRVVGSRAARCVRASRRGRRSSGPRAAVALPRPLSLRPSPSDGGRSPQPAAGGPLILWVVEGGDMGLFDVFRRGGRRSSHLLGRIAYEPQVVGNNGVKYMVFHVAEAPGTEFRLTMLPTTPTRRKGDRVELTWSTQGRHRDRRGPVLGAGSGVGAPTERGVPEQRSGASQGRVLTHGVGWADGRPAPRRDPAPNEQRETDAALSLHVPIPRGRQRLLVRWRPAGHGRPSLPFLLRACDRSAAALRNEDAGDRQGQRQIEWG